MFHKCLVPPDSRGSLLTFSITPRDNVIMVRELLLSDVSPPCDERKLCEHVKHHTPEHLSVSVCNTSSPPSYRTPEGKDIIGGGVIGGCSDREAILLCLAEPKDGAFGSRHTVDCNAP